jgi:hypothetical protein
VGGGAYIEGTHVLVAVFSENAKFDEASKVAGLPNVIIGSYAAWPLHDGTDFGPTKITIACAVWCLIRKLVLKFSDKIAAIIGR